MAKITERGAAADKAARPAPLRPEPTADEKKNGWTRDSLAQYLAERADQTQQFAKLKAERAVRPARAETVHRFDPHRW